MVDQKVESESNTELPTGQIAGTGAEAIPSNSDVGTQLTEEQISQLIDKLREKGYVYDLRFSRELDEMPDPLLAKVRQVPGTNIAYLLWEDLSAEPKV